MARKVNHCVLMVLLALSVQTKASDLLDEVGFLLNREQPEKAILWIEQKLAAAGDQESTVEDLDILRFSLGKLLFDRGSFSQSLIYLKPLAERVGTYRDWARLYLGKVHVRQQEYTLANKALVPLLGRRKPTKIQWEAHRELADSALARKKWKIARDHLRRLERKTRGTEEHPETVWQLLTVEQKKKNTSRVCRWSKKMYHTYPLHESVHSWGLSLSKNTVVGQATNCQETQSDRIRRVKRLHWSGSNDRAKEEVQALRGQIDQDEWYRLWAEYLVLSGDVKKAFEPVFEMYSRQKNGREYLMLLASLSAKNREYSVASAIYNKIYQKNKKNRHGRKALFQSAFADYLGKNYDGAIQKFSQFQKNHKNSGLVRDAWWYLGWSYYLKNDFENAISQFNQILYQTRRRRRFWKRFNPEKVRYWRAVSYLNLGQRKKAAKDFQELTRDSLISFYSILSEVQIKKAQLESLRLPAEDKSLKSEEEPIQPLLQAAVFDQSFLDESEEGLHELSLREPVVEEVDEFQDEELFVSEQEDKRLDGIAVLFEDSRYQSSVERARQFTHLGFFDMAKWELYEVERKTKNKKQLEGLAYQYQLIDAHHRSALIGQTHFLNERKDNSMAESLNSWKFTYPRAYRSEVKTNELRFAVEKEFIWSIIRAESRYRHKVKSPVGATGLMQLMPYTARELGDLMAESISDFEQLKEPEVNIKLGTRYLRRLLSQFGGKYPLAAASYNAGPHRVNSWLDLYGHREMAEWIEHVPYVETRTYIKKVLRNYYVYHKVYNEKPVSMTWLTEPVGVSSTSENYFVEDWKTRYSN